MFMRKKWLRSLHTILGIFVLIPLLVFTATGVLLNHKHELGLSETFVKSEWIMKQYGLDLSSDPIAWNFKGNGFFAQYTGQYVLNGKSIQLDGTPLSAIKISSGFCVASSSKIHFYDPRGLLIEELEVGLSLPAGIIKNLGISQDNSLIIRYKKTEVTSEATYYVAKNPELMDFAPAQAADAQYWAEQGELSTSNHKLAKKAIIASGQPLERVLLDLHSGNIFSLAGKIFVDLFAIGIFGLSISGLLIAKRKWRKS